MRPRKRLALQVEALEPKALLSSSTLPVLTQNRYTDVLMSINHYATGFSIDFRIKVLGKNLALVAPLVPFGTRDLLPIWQKDLAGFNPRVKDAAHTMIVQITTDFNDYVQAGVVSGKFAVTGKVFHTLHGPNPPTSA